MSLSRAFTTRRSKRALADAAATPQRSSTVAKGNAPSLPARLQISAPMELTHTTNMLAYDAPDLYPRSTSESSSSKSDEESDSAETTASSPPTSPDVALKGDRPVSVERNHLSCYFARPGQNTPDANDDAPVIPRRAPSHTKKASCDNLVRRRSMSRLSGWSHKSRSSKASFHLSRSSSTSTSHSTVASVLLAGSHAKKTSHAAVSSSPPPANRPSKQTETSEHSRAFGQELGQVSEIAEDGGTPDKLLVEDEETQMLRGRGLCIYRADDYASEIHNLYSAFFARSETKLRTVDEWI